MDVSKLGTHRPEIVIGLAGPIGVDMDAVIEEISAALKSVDYDTRVVHLTTEMRRFVDDVPSDDADYFSLANSLMECGNTICANAQDPSAIARIGIMAVREVRAKLTGQDGSTPARAMAYIIRQLKRPEEVTLFRRVYGAQFVLVSAHGSPPQRLEVLLERLRRSHVTSIRPHKLMAQAHKLINDDASDDRAFGQRLRDTFHRADAFVDGLDRQHMRRDITRIVNALFGRTDITPTRAEFGMYSASSAALRSADLSRQVGAAIFSPEGEVISLGCNEVPRAFGGTYWDSEEPDHRDVRIGHDPNAREIREVLRDLFQRLKDAGLLSGKAQELGDVARLISILTMPRGNEDQPGDPSGLLNKSMILDLTEFGRVVHAEMNAICEAARLGRSVRGGILFCTTFPCHNCTKHILASGIQRVIYVEPYPKSRADQLHAHEITVVGEHQDRVVFAPFLGIAPTRYRDIFQKSRRKNAQGEAMRWYAKDGPQPMVDAPYPAYPAYPAYLELEKFELAPLLGTIADAQSD